MAHKVKGICKEGKCIFSLSFSTAKPNFTGFTFLCLPLKPKILKIILFGFFHLLEIILEVTEQSVGC